MTYRIVCTEQEPTYHAHIIAVGTGDDSNTTTQRWIVDEVLRALDRGDVFYTKGEVSGCIALVEKYTCTPCRRVYIRSKADAVRDNNLDNLRACSWRARTAA